VVRRQGAASAGTPTRAPPPAPPQPHLARAHATVSPPRASVEPLATCGVRGLREQDAEEGRSPCRIAPFQGLQGRCDVPCYIATADLRWSALNTARHRVGGGVSGWSSYENRSPPLWSALAGSLRRRVRFPPPPLQGAMPRPPSGEPGFSLSPEAVSASRASRPCSCRSCAGCGCGASEPAGAAIETRFRCMVGRWGPLAADRTSWNPPELDVLAGGWLESSQACC
jgi:hypothetical protein